MHLCVCVQKDFFNIFGYRCRNGRVTLHSLLGELPGGSAEQLPLASLGGFQSLCALVSLLSVFSDGRPPGAALVFTAVWICILLMTNDA